MAKTGRGSMKAPKLPVGAFLLLLAIAWGFYLFFGKPLKVFSSSSEEMVLYEVPKNATTSFLARDLYSKGLISFPLVFKAFIRITDREKRIRAGFYYLPMRNSIMEMAERLTSGKMATHTVTIPEGKASWEIYGILKQDFPMDSIVFDSLVRDKDFAYSLGLKAPGCEGYLFPDTYILPWKISEKDALRSLIKRFQEVAVEMNDGSEVVKLYGIHGWVTLASIVEKEAAVNSEETLIAGVFYNRLRQNWSLGADPTTRFALRKLTGPLLTKDLNAKSPYNTRLYSGLPPGPVCNPGRDALLAALQPRKTKMMFFVAKDDGSREHYFSATNDEHNAFKAQAAENRRRHAEILDSVIADKALQEKTFQLENGATVANPEPKNTKISAAP